MNDFKTPEGKYLYEILENTFENTNTDCLRDSDARSELRDAVMGIDATLYEQGVKIDALEKTAQRLEAWCGRNGG